MIIEKQELDGATLLRVEGVIKLGQSASFFADALQRVLEEEGGHVVIDLSRINMIDSTGIGELVGYLARFRDRRRELILVNPSDRIRRLLEVAHLSELFPIHETVEDALAAGAERRRPAMGARRGTSLVLAAIALVAGGGCRTVFEGKPLRPAVTPGVAFSMLRDAPYLPILDLRPADQFHGPFGHMAGARSIPLDVLADHRVELRAYERVTVLAYCAADECGSAEHALLVEWGVEDAVLIDGGLAAWIEAGYGTVHRAAPPSIPTDGPLPEEVAEEILEEAAAPP